MKPFRSGFAKEIQEFIAYRKFSGVWNEGYERSLSLFDSFCAKNYPENAPINQEMIDRWSAKHEKEKNVSRNCRIRALVAFIRYLRQRGLSDVTEPIKMKPEPSTYVPHAFTEDELRKFFEACDNIPVKDGYASLIKHMTCPVLFRLLYSSGIRTTEARYLKRKDFDREHGVLNIQKGKGYDQHYVALHASMTELLAKYDDAIDKVQPDREYLFQGPNGEFRTRRWLTSVFKEIWNEANGNSQKVIPYELRHHYAVVNINNWTGGQGFEFNDHLLYLSKSMGHKRIESTLVYYSLVPSLADTILEKTEEGFNEIVPEVRYEE